MPQNNRKRGASSAASDRGNKRAKATNEGKPENQGHRPATRSTARKATDVPSTTIVPPEPAMVPVASSGSTPINSALFPPPSTFPIIPSFGASTAVHPFLSPDFPVVDTMLPVTSPQVPAGTMPSDMGLFSSTMVPYPTTNHVLSGHECHFNFDEPLFGAWLASFSQPQTDNSLISNETFTPDLNLGESRPANFSNEFQIFNNEPPPTFTISPSQLVLTTITTTSSTSANGSPPTPQNESALFPEVVPNVTERLDNTRAPPPMSDVQGYGGRANEAPEIESQQPKDINATDDSGKPEVEYTDAADGEKDSTKHTEVSDDSLDDEETETMLSYFENHVARGKAHSKRVMFLEKKLTELDIVSRPYIFVFIGRPESICSSRGKAKIICSQNLRKILGVDFGDNMHDQVVDYARKNLFDLEAAKRKNVEVQKARDEKEQVKREKEMAEREKERAEREKVKAEREKVRAEREKAQVEQKVAVLEAQLAALRGIQT